MTALIHGVLSWREDRAQVDAALLAMARAVGVGALETWSAAADHTVAGLAVRSIDSIGRVGIEERPGLAAVADYRIDNADELVRATGAPPLAAPLPAASPSALILDRYRALGAETPRGILGDGVAAVWDERRQRLVCWRDQVGVRPLYYAHQPGRRFVFSSDLRALAAHPAVKPSLDLAYCRALFDHGQLYQHPQRTLCVGILKLEGGHVATVDRNGLVVRRYWDPTDISERRHADDAEYLEELRHLLDEAVRRRLPSDTTAVGAHLSGGLDSSSIAVVAHRVQSAAGRRLEAFSWAPPYDAVDMLDRDERLLAHAVADHGQVSLHYTRLESRDFLAYETRDLSLQPSTTLQIEVATSRAARELGVSTMLSGWGGDEFAVFNGRGYFADLARQGRWRTMVREMRLRSDFYESSLLGMVKSRALLPLVPDRLLPLVPGYSSMPEPTLPWCLRPDFGRELGRAERLDPPMLRERPGVRQMQLDLLRYGHLQYRTESWASHGADIGIDYAFPMLDRRLVEFALSIPDRLYFTNGWKRWLYRAAMQGVLPDEVRWNPTKFDDAMLEQLRANRAAASNAFREQLDARRDNPYIDVDKVGTAPPPEAGDPPRLPDEVATWLAFTKVMPA